MPRRFERALGFSAVLLAGVALVGVWNFGGYAGEVRWFVPDPSSALRAEGGTLRLDRAHEEHVISDDTGDAGSHQDITGPVVIRKTFDLPTLLPLGRVTAAHLEANLYRAATNRTPLAVTVNGHALQLDTVGEADKYVWRSVPIEPRWLHAGTNTVEMTVASATSNAAWAILTTRSTHPNRSAVSLDGGQTWQTDRLGNDGSENGEYTVRLRLHTAADGEAISSIQALGRPGQPVDPLKMASARGVEQWVRSGPLAVPDARWSEWTRLRPGTPVITPADHRYFQRSIRLEITGAQLPELVTTTQGGDLPTPAVDVNAWLPYGSRFRYQDPSHAALKRLRAAERLDGFVAATGQSEDALVETLRDWARRQFPDGDPNPYPPLNAMTILDWIRAGRTQGFCGQHAYVLGQALLSLGFQIRYVELGMNRPTRTGPAYFPAVHFALEYWSPSRAKWIFVDPNKNLRVTLDGVPLSAREIHDVYMEYFDLPMRRNTELTPWDGDPERSGRRPVTSRPAAGGTLTIVGWDLDRAGRLEVEQGPTAAGGWSLDNFYYLRVRLRNDELMHASQSPADLVALSPRNRDGFNPNGMLEYEDPRSIPLREPIAVYVTSSADEFDWRLDLVDARATDGYPARVQASTTWPYPSAYRLRSGDIVLTSADGEFTLPRAYLAGSSVEVLDANGRTIGRADVTSDGR